MAITREELQELLSDMKEAPIKTVYTRHAKLGTTPIQKESAFVQPDEEVLRAVIPFAAFPKVVYRRGDGKVDHLLVADADAEARATADGYGDYPDPHTEKKAKK